MSNPISHTHTLCRGRTSLRRVRLSTNSRQCVCVCARASPRSSFHVLTNKKKSLRSQDRDRFSLNIMNGPYGIPVVHINVTGLVNASLAFHAVFHTRSSILKAFELLYEHKGVYEIINHDIATRLFGVRIEHCAKATGQNVYYIWFDELNLRPIQVEYRPNTETMNARYVFQTMQCTGCNLVATVHVVDPHDMHLTISGVDKSNRRLTEHIPVPTTFTERLNHLLNGSSAYCSLTSFFFFFFFHFIFIRVGDRREWETDDP